MTFVGVFVLGPVLAVPATAALSWPIRRFRGVPGRLASTNARRNPRRTAGAAVALTIGVSLVGFIAAFAASAKVSIADSIDRNFSGDLVLTSGPSGRRPASARIWRRASPTWTAWRRWPRSDWARRRSTGWASPTRRSSPWRPPRSSTSVSSTAT
ncbi:MAG: hypothetical protein R2690_01540 [Acidimicrobiales bacterium]